MARSEARVSVDIWDDPDFRALTGMQQRDYLFLLSQRDLCHTGVVPLRERRWARTASDLDVQRLLTDLKVLERARFVTVDEDTEEVFVRALFRRDKVYRQPNVLRAAADQVVQIESATIRVALLGELRRVAESGDVPAASAAAFDQMVAALTPSGTPSATPSETPTGRGCTNPHSAPTEGVRDDAERHLQSGETEARRPYAETTRITAQTAGMGGSPAAQDISATPSGTPSATPSAASPGERGVVTAVSSGSPIPNPLSPSPVPPETASPSPARADKPRDERRGTRIPEDFSITPEMAAWAREHVPELAGRGETEKFIDFWRAKPGAAGRKTDWPATWRNWMRTAAERLPQNRPTSAPPANVYRGRDPRSPNPFAKPPADAPSGAPRREPTHHQEQLS